MRCEDACVYVFLCVLSRVKGVSQAKLVLQEREATLVGWDCQEDKETWAPKDNQ